MSLQALLIARPGDLVVLRAQPGETLSEEQARRMRASLRVYEETGIRFLVVPGGGVEASVQPKPRCTARWWHEAHSTPFYDVDPRGPQKHFPEHYDECARDAAHEDDLVHPQYSGPRRGRGSPHVAANGSCWTDSEAHAIPANCCHPHEVSH